MKKAFTYTGVFVGGFVACALALKTLGDPSLSLLPGNDNASKRAVLTSLDTSPRPAPRFAGDSVVADAAAKLEPSIVDIHTMGKPVQSAASPFGGDPIFRRLFPQIQGTPQVPEGAGSGVIISPDGYIMTNNHVIANTSTVKVTVGQGDNQKEYTARVIGSDPVSDIAVLKINPTSPLRAAELGDSDGIRVGDWAIAVGNPLDIGTTVTLGIISAKDRKDLQADGGVRLAGTRIQTDAAINPGNSGGALADINGRVVGINEAILSPTGSYIGIGLAIPINDAKKIAAELIRSGKVVRPYLGVAYEPLKNITDLDDRRQYGLPLETDDGAVVEGVYPNSPAAAAGLQKGDLITAADGKKITDLDALQNEIQARGVGQTLSLSVSHRGQSKTVNILLRAAPTNYGVVPQQSQDGQQGSPDEQQQSPDDQQAPNDQSPMNPFGQ